MTASHGVREVGNWGFFTHDNQGEGIAIWESLNMIVRNNTFRNESMSFRNLTERVPFRNANISVYGNKFYGVGTIGHGASLAAVPARAADPPFAAHSYRSV